MGVLQVVEVFAAAEQKAQGDDECVNERIIAAPVDARIGQSLKMFVQTEAEVLLLPDSGAH